MDSIVRVWDLPTGHLIDGFRTPSIITSLSFSPDGNFLATASIDSVGIGLYTNKTIFSHVPTRRLLESEISKMNMPTASGEGGVSLIDSAFSENDNDVDLEGVYSTVDQLSNKMLTMSLVPKSKWMTMLNLEAIKQRNKPKEPPKAPEKAPFFLTLNGKDTADIPALDGITTDDKIELSRVNKFSLTNGTSNFQRPFTKLLMEGYETNDCMSSCPPSFSLFSLSFSSSCASSITTAILFIIIYHDLPLLKFIRTDVNQSF